MKVQKCCTIFTRPHFPYAMLKGGLGVWGWDLGNSKYIKHKLRQNDKHCLYHSNGVLWSFILPSITLLHPCKKAYLLHMTLASVIQRTGWSSPCQPFSHCIPPLPILNYIICRWNRRNTYAGDSAVCICVHASVFACVRLCTSGHVKMQHSFCIQSRLSFKDFWDVLYKYKSLARKRIYILPVTWCK